MKKFSLFMALVMAISMVSLTGLAEEPLVKESASGFYYIEQSGEQARLSAASKDAFIQADGLTFKDLNGNGQLDVYEDYRRPTEERVKDLLSQMSESDKAGTLIFACIAGKNGSTVTDFNAAVTGFQNDVGSANTITPEHPAIVSREPVVKVGEATYLPTAYQIQDMHVTTFIAALTGAPKDQLDLFNKIQSIAEDTPLGIPATFSGDRSYNTWGGMIDMPHYALGVAHDPDLLYNLVSEYAKESVALGYHQVFHGYGDEIGSWYGDDVNYIAEMSAAETKAYEDQGFQSHSKHFIARGGRNAYVNAKSPANLLDSWLVGWKAVVDAGTQWVMTNNNEGVTPGVQGYMDKDTYDILRGTLGYKGVVCLDWPLDIASLMTKTGVLADGTDVSTLSAVERYALILNAGVDMFSCYGAIPGTDIEAYSDNSNRALPGLIVQAVSDGLVTAESLDEHVGRVLTQKFNLGSFEDPYRDWADALALIGSDAYKAEQTVPLSNAEINAARRPEITEMEQQVMVESSVLLKNDGVLPLAKGAKLYVDSNNGTIKDADLAALAAYGTIVETFEEADVCVFHITAFDDAYDYMMEDAMAAGKPVVVITESTNVASTEPRLFEAANCGAILMQTYRNTPDHGASVGSFYRYVDADVTADMLFGVREPKGTTLFEIGKSTDDYNLSWGELQMDIGVDDATRLYMAMMARENPTLDMPTNLGDVLWTANFGMGYSAAADIELCLLTVPQEATVVETETNGRVRTSVDVHNATLKAGEPFELHYVAKNHGADGHMNVQVLDGDKVVSEKFVALDEGQFRVISTELTLEAGEHVLTVGGMSTTVTVE